MAEGDYQRLEVTRPPPRPTAAGAGQVLSKQFKVKETLSVIGTPTFIAFSPVSPYTYAVGSSTRVSLVSQYSHRATGNISRFRDTVQAGAFRNDGAVFLAGSNDGMLQAFDVSTRKVLRRIRAAHSGPCRAVCFAPDGVGLVSGGNDGVIRLHDLATGVSVCSWAAAHSDSVRAVAALSSRGLLVSAGHDGAVKLWDSRMATHEPAAVLIEAGGLPCEALTVMPGDGLVAVAAGPTIRCLDVTRSAAAPVAQATVAAKAITSLAMDTDGLLLAGALDHAVRSLDPVTLETLSTLRIGAPVTAVGASPDGALLAVASADSKIHIRAKPSAGAGQSASTDYWASLAQQVQDLAGPGHIGPSTASKAWWARAGQAAPTSAGDIVCAGSARQRLSRYDVFLRRFEYRRALVAALSSHDAPTTAALIVELARREPNAAALQIALRGMPDAQVAAAASFAARYLSEPGLARPSSILLEAIVAVHGAAVLAEPACALAVSNAHAAAERELQLCDDLAQLQGALGAILGA
jgi:U3 small nucleolar RNA-associated protein 15